MIYKIKIMKKHIPSFDKFLEENLDFEKIYDHIKKHFDRAQTHDELKKLKKEADDLKDENTDRWDEAAINYFYKLRKEALGKDIDAKSSFDVGNDRTMFLTHPHIKQYRKTF